MIQEIVIVAADVHHSQQVSKDSRKKKFVSLVYVWFCGDDN
jgi:hypothetical protein